MSKARKRLLIIVSLVIAGAALMTHQHKEGSLSLLRSLASPFDLMNGLTTGIGERFEGVWDAREENLRLKKQLQTLLLERQRYGEALQENKRLREVLALKDSQPQYLATARVVARGYDRLLNTVIIDKGASSGVRKDMAVITTKGLAGKVYSVREGFSEVLLLRDPNFSVAARLQESRSEGVMSGEGSRQCSLKYIPPETAVRKGEVVVTSGLDGLFPPGLPIGVVSVVKKGTGFFQQITVQPFQSEASLEEAVILGK